MPKLSASSGECGTKVFATGGGIGSLAAAAFMIRDGGLPGANITIYEALPVLGGSLDAAGNPETGYSLRGGRMFTTDNYGNHCFQRAEQIALASPGWWIAIAPRSI